MAARIAARQGKRLLGRCGHFFRRWRRSLAGPLHKRALAVRRCKGLSATTIPAARGRFAARTRNARPYDPNKEILQKTTVCSAHPTFWGSSCGLREIPCSRNGYPIPLARAKPGRGRQYGTGQPGGQQRLGRCLSLGCTPRSPKGVRGPQPPARFRHFSAVKSAPPEAAPAHGGGNETRLRRVRADVGIGPYTSTKLPFPP